MFPQYAKRNAQSYIYQASLSLLAVAALIGHSTEAQAQRSARRVAQAAPAAQSAPAAQPTNDKLDVSDLERKYWAAKDTDFSVVQNRLFSKAGRFSLGLGYGTLINDSWSDGPTYSAAANYYFSERYGVELAYTNTESKDSDATQRLRANQGGMPNHNKLKSFYGVAFNWVPFYAKMSVLNSNIVYFDMAISPGVGITEYEQQMEESSPRKTAPTLTLDITQQFFLTKWFALRFDFKNRWYREDIMYYRASSVPAGSDRKVSTDLNYTSIVMGGLTFFF